jgi:hypothetical protein
MSPLWPHPEKMRLTVTHRADQFLVSERMGKVFDWQTAAPLDHLVVRRNGGERMGCLSSALNFGMASVDRRPNSPDYGYDAHRSHNNALAHPSSPR